MTTVHPPSPNASGANSSPNQSQPPQQTVSSQTGQTTTTSTSQTGQPVTNSAPVAWPTELPLTERYITDPNWPVKLRLDLNSGNWEEWSHHMCIVVQNQGFCHWLDGTFTPPDINTTAGRYYIWKSNDDSLKVFLLHTISREECKAVKSLLSANAVWNELRIRHEKRGLYAQLMLIKECLAIRFNMTTPLNKMINQIDDLVSRISNMGDIDWNKFKTIMLINALGGELEHVQSQIHGMADEPSFSAEKIVHRIYRERDLIKHRAAQGEGPTALISETRRKDRERTICSHCQRPGHTAEFCISHGGKYAGHTIEEARAAQRTAWARERAQRTTPSVNIATTETQNISRPPSPAPSTATSNSMLINGVTWVPLPSPVDTAQLALGPIVDPKDEFSIYHAEDECEINHWVSLDWNEFSYPIDSPDASYAYEMSSAYKMPHKSPFVLDSGASCHISPDRDDFKTFTPTAPHPITGFGESCAHAIGVGTIELKTKSGTCLTLDRVLFVPNSTVRLISVFSINNNGDNTCYFDAKSCCVIGPSGTILISGTAWKQRRLYTLDCVPHNVNDASTNESTVPSTNPTDSAFYASRTPNLETWHRRLGHCNHRTIIDMARHGVVEGMPIDLSSTPAACDHCILGKQTHSHVPAMCEGERASKRLERIFVDLCGPMPAVSNYGHLYSMNMIDDFSSYVWSLPLARKSEAVNVLWAWHHAVENQTGDKLKIVVTDNGELLSHTMTAWCTLHDIKHQLTAPYTSAHNGRAERLHRTILEKARAMRLSCNAPPKLWDEFCATSA